MTKFTRENIGWNTAMTVQWFGERGREIQPSHILKHRSGTLIDYDGKPQRAIAVVIKDDTQPSEIDLYCLNSLCAELYDSIPRKAVME